MGKTALDNFYELDVEPSLEEALDNLEKDFQENKQELKKMFVCSFKKICLKIKEIERTTGMKTGFIMYNLLRTRILQHKYEYAIVVYDKDWYIKDGIKVGDMDVSFCYKHFEGLWQKLAKEFKKYALKVSILDVERVVFDQLDSFHKYVVELMRYSILDALETEEYISLEKEDLLEIQSGEFYEPCDTIHMEEKEKNIIKIKKWMKENKKQVYCFQDFRGIDLSDLKYQNADLRYTDFRGSRLDGLNISVSLLIGTKFKGSSMKDANLAASMICDANFENADMTGAKLQSCVAYIGKNQANEWKRVGFTGTSFKNCILKEANFTGATIIGADFEGADLTGAVFEDANLYKSHFSKKQLEQISLSKEQIKQIEIIK